MLESTPEASEQAANAAIRIALLEAENERLRTIRRNDHEPDRSADQGKRKNDEAADARHGSTVVDGRLGPERRRSTVTHADQPHPREDVSAAR